MKRLSLLIGLLLCLQLQAQDREAAIWYFGQFAGVDFNSLTPQSLDDGMLHTGEGCSTISNEDGNLLFYSDGVGVYENDHQLIPTSLDLLGSYFSTQSALIVPRPNDPEFFFLFTVSDIRRANAVLEEGDGLNYYVVNASERGATLGTLTNHLVTYDESDRARSLLKCSQKLTAVKDPNNEVYWVVTHFEDTFYAFKIDENEVSNSPVTSKVGPLMYLGAHGVNSRGQLKLSPDGKKLAMANYQNSVDSGGHSPGSLYLFDFDVLTGIVSQPVQLMPNDFVFAYGVEFSPDSNKVYASVSSFLNGEVPPSGHDNSGSSLWQIDLADNYRVRKLYEDLNEPMALQLSIDGKIYKAQENRRYLGIINNPNRVGSNVNYEDNGVSIQRPSLQGLPSFVQSFFQVRIEYEAACEGEITELSTNYLPEPDNIDWDFGDGTQLLNTTDKEPQHVYSNAGSYLVSATITKGSETTTYTKIVNVRTLPNVAPATLIQCDGDGDGIADFNLNEASRLINTDPSLKFRFFYTEPEALNEESEILGITYFFSNENTSRVFVRVENEFGCFRITTLDLEVQSTVIPADFYLNLEACDDFIDEDDTDGIGTFNFSEATRAIQDLFPDTADIRVSYFRSEGDAAAEIREIDPENYRNEDAPFSQELWIRVDGSNNNACLGLGQHISLRVNTVPEFQLLKELSVCQKELPYRISASGLNEDYTYVWTDDTGTAISTEPYVDASIEGSYTLTATKADGTFCEKSKTIEINTIPPPVITGVDVEGIITLRSTATVITEESEGFEYALDNDSGPYQDSNIFYEVAPGIHQAFVRDKNNCELVSKEFSVIGHPAFFTPNNDGINDYWQLQGVSESIQANSLIHIYDRYGVLLAQLDPSSIGWDGMTEGQMLPASDYWFRVQLEDGREFSGHFALKR